MSFSRFGWGVASQALEFESRLGKLLKVLVSGPYPQILIQQVLGGLRSLL